MGRGGLDEGVTPVTFKVGKLFQLSRKKYYESSRTSHRGQAYLDIPTSLVVLSDLVVVLVISRKDEGMT